MRTIQVDEAVFSAIWTRWKEGDGNENGVLRRIFALPPVESLPASGAVISTDDQEGGYTDKRTGTVFPLGFEIFRTFKKTPYRATVSKGVWRLADGRTAPSLNALSVLIGARTENAWLGWYYKDRGETKLINEFRLKRGVD